MKSGHGIYLALRNAEKPADVLPVLDNGQLRSVLTYLARRTKHSEISGMIRGLAVVEAAERFRRGKKKGSPL